MPGTARSSPNRIKSLEAAVAEAFLFPDVTAKKLDRALASPVAPLGDLSTKPYCGKLKVGLGKTRGGCKKAAITVHHDGAITYNVGARGGTYCLAPSASWGKRVIVRLAPAKRPASLGVCGVAEQGKTYSVSFGSRADPSGKMIIWARGSAANLKTRKKQALAVAGTQLQAVMVERIVRGFYNTGGKTQVAAFKKAIKGLNHPEITPKAQDEYTKAHEKLLAAAGRALPTVADESKRIVGLVGKPISAKQAEALAAIVRKARKQASKRLLKEVPDRPFAVGMLGKSYDAYVDGYGRPPTGKEIKAMRAASVTAVRTVALAHQSDTPTQLPWTIFTGRVPSTKKSVRIVALKDRAADLGTHGGRFYNGDRLVLFGHDMPPGQARSMAVLQGAKLAAKGNAVLKVVAALFKVTKVGLLRTNQLLSQKSFHNAFQNLAEQACQDQSDPLDVMEKLHGPIEQCSGGTCSKCAGAKQAASSAGSQPSTNSKPAPCGYLAVMKELYQHSLVRFIGTKKLESASAKAAAPYTSDVIHTDVTGGYRYNLKICGSKTCTKKTEAAEVTSRQEVKVHKIHRVVSTVTELGVNFFWPLPLGWLSLCGGRGGYRPRSVV